MDTEKYQLLKSKALPDNYIQLISDQWLLVTAGRYGEFNMMTASWGGAGYLWNKPVFFIFIRPQRYTFDFIERNDVFTLSVFEEKYREALKVCGTISGRDTDKVKESGLTPMTTGEGRVAFEEARLIFECKKMYAEFLKPEAFIEQKIIGQVYPEHDYHKMYIAEIVNVWEKK